MGHSKNPTQAARLKQTNPGQARVCLRERLQQISTNRFLQLWALGQG